MKLHTAFYCASIASSAAAIVTLSTYCMAGAINLLATSELDRLFCPVASFGMAAMFSAALFSFLGDRAE